MLKKVIAINGSPRKKGNTVTLLNKALEGANSVGAQTELIHLYDLNFKGCASCFACKRKDSKFIGQCAIKDDLTDVLNKIMECDVLLLGSPLYLGDITANMRALLERLIFMNYSYDHPTNRSTFKGKISTGFIYTMGATTELMKTGKFDANFEINERFLKVLNGDTEYMISADTYQFDDYTKYAAAAIDVEHKTKVRAEQFPMDCENAYQLAIRLLCNHEALTTTTLKGDL